MPFGSPPSAQPDGQGVFRPSLRARLRHYGRAERLIDTRGTLRQVAPLLTRIMHHEDAKTRRGLITNRLCVLGFGAAVAQMGRLPASQQRWCPLRPNVLRPFVSWCPCLKQGELCGSWIDQAKGCGIAWTVSSPPEFRLQPEAAQGG